MYWKTPPVKNPEQLRNIGWKTNLASDYSRLYSYPAYQLLNENTKSFSDVAIWRRIPSPVTEWGPVWLQLVSGNYFRTLGINAIRGRTLTTLDDQPGNFSAVAVVSYGFWQRAFGRDPSVLGRTMKLSGVSFEIVGVLPQNFTGLDPISPASWSRSVRIVNELFARTFFSGGEPLGQVVGIGRCPGLRRTVIGIVADHKDRQRAQITPMVYQQNPTDEPVGAPTFSLRTKGDPEVLISAVRRIMSELNATLIGDVTTGKTYKSINQKQERLLMSLLLFFAALGLLISCLGLYGLLAYVVGCRSSEIGIRIALGAGKVDLIRLVACEFLTPVAGGIAFGFIGVFASARWLEKMLYGVASTDPWTISSAAIILMLVAVFAAIGPVRTALHVECTQQLRSE